MSNGNLNFDGTKGISLLTVRGSGAVGSYADPSLGNSANSGMVRVNTNLVVGGLDNTGNAINTRIVSQGAGQSRTLTLDVGNTLSYVYSGTLSDGTAMRDQGDSSTLALVKNGLGTQTIAGQSYLHNYSGGTTVNAGTLIVQNGGPAVAKTTTGANVGNGSTANFNVGDTTGLYVGKPVDGFANVFISSIVSGTTVAITNRSGGTVAIPANLTFGATSPTGTGDVTVAGGTFQADGYVMGSVNLTGGTLAGTGQIAGNVSVGAGATLSPGASIGTLEIGGDLTLEPLSTSFFEISRTAGPVYANDQVIGIADLVYGGTLQIALDPGSDPIGLFEAGDAWTLFGFSTYSGQWANDSIFGTAGDGVTLPVLGGSQTWAFDYTTGTLSVQEFVIPEPGTGLLVLLGGLAGLALRRRRDAE